MKVLTEEEINMGAEEAIEEMILLMQYAEQTGISTDDISSKYSLKKFNYSTDKSDMMLSFEKRSIEKNKSVNDETVTLTFDQQKQLITVVQRTEKMYDFRTMGDDPMTSFETWRRRVEHNVTEFEMNNGRLNVTTASMSQSMKDDTFGGACGMIVYFNSINDFKDEKKMRWTGYSTGYGIKTESYEVPEGYQLQDGLAPITSAAKNFQK